MVINLPIQYYLDIATKHNYVVLMDMGNDGKLIRLLMVNPTTIQFMRTWPHVILIDTTYITNNKKWLLRDIVGMTPTNHNFLVVFCLMRDE